MNVLQHILILGVRFYRWTLSPAMAVVFGPLARCRFTPSCSEYALEAIRSRGALAGSGLALKRIGRCHPWGGSGYDPVPLPKSEIRNPNNETSGAPEEPCTAAAAASPSRLEGLLAGRIEIGTVELHGQRHR